MSPEATLDLFDELVDSISSALGELDDWGLSGQRETQYRHDVVADEIVVPRLLASGFSVLSEESGLTGDGTVTVVVDPIDGSTNGSRGLPWYATSLCAVDAEGPQTALVANLGTGTRFRAVRGAGIEVVSGQGSIEAKPSGCQNLEEAIVAVSGWPPSHGGWAQYRALGAAALDMCAVASGVLDGYIDIDRAHGVWDYLGAVLVCREAGAFVVDGLGDDLVVLDRDERRAPVAAASQELLASLLDLAALWRSQSA